MKRPPIGASVHAPRGDSEMSDNDTVMKIYPPRVFAAVYCPRGQPPMRFRRTDAHNLKEINGPQPRPDSLTEIVRDWEKSHGAPTKESHGSSRSAVAATSRMEASNISGPCSIKMAAANGQVPCPRATGVQHAQSQQAKARGSKVAAPTGVLSSAV